MANKYLNNNGLPYLWSKIKSLLSGKVDKVDGKGLSTNDYTTAEKQKLYDLPTADELQTLTDTKQDKLTAGTGLSLSGTTINHANSITAGRIGSIAQTAGRIVSIPYANYDSTGHITSKGTRNHIIPIATSSTDGLMSASDKTKLDNLSGGMTGFTLIGTSSLFSTTTMLEIELDEEISYSDQYVIAFVNDDKDMVLGMAYFAFLADQISVAMPISDWIANDTCAGLQILNLVKNDTQTVWIGFAGWIQDVEHMNHWSDEGWLYQIKIYRVEK